MSHYVHEKMWVAIDCLCGDGTFTERLSNATLSALERLKPDDLEGNLGKDLEYVLSWTRDNASGDKIECSPSARDRRTLVEKMLHILVETGKSD